MLFDKFWVPSQLLYSFECRFTSFYLLGFKFKNVILHNICHCLGQKKINLFWSLRTFILHWCCSSRVFSSPPNSARLRKGYI
ncbi:hypothetical protein V5799_013111 [Amblyomma americanum]|uniref:Uncharacterized protein n=1 Tax=Amblyomma americanum TaxID=6943 RepID=A0AAQ4E6S9_AMBAM